MSERITRRCQGPLVHESTPVPRSRQDRQRARRSARRGRPPCSPARRPLRDAPFLRASRELRGGTPEGPPGLGREDDKGAARLRRCPRASFARPAAATATAAERASEPASATKRLPRQADLTDPARAVTRRRVGSDVSPAGRPQPGARLGDAPAPGLPLREADPAASRLARGRAGLGGVSGGPRLARPPRDTRAAAAPTGAAAGGPPWRPATT